MRFELNRKKLVELAKFRGWISEDALTPFNKDLPRGLITRLAHELGFTPSYCRRVILGHEKLCVEFMLQYIKVAGCSPSNPQEWGSLFVANTSGKIPEPHDPEMNRLKINGMGKKYRHNSPYYKLRQNDDPNLEQETLDESFRVPGRSKP